MDANLLSLIGSLVAVITAIGGVYVSFSAKKKNNAEADSAIVAAANSLIEPLTRRVSELEKLTVSQENKIADLKRKTGIQHSEIAELRAGIHLLTTQILALGQKPLYQPKNAEERADSD